MNKRHAQKISDAIIANLRDRRIDAGVSQYRLAQDTGMSKSSISYIENLKQRPTLYTAIMIANCLGVRLSDIIRQIEDKS
jgi:transcriptional regulator with XRE-family HTH domain